MTQMQDKRRLLEMIEYLDSRYIEEMFDDLKIPERQTELTTAKRSKIKHLRYLIPLAACILLLSIASPLVSYIAQVISNFNAGAGSTNTSELLTEPETTNGMYDEYILTEEDLAELNEAFFKREFLDNPEHTHLNEEEINRVKNSKYGKFAETVEGAMLRLIDGGTCYFGKFGNSIVVANNGIRSSRYDIGNNVFEFPAQEILVCYDSTFHELDEAYERGLVTENDVEKLYELSNTFYFNYN